VTMYQIEKEIVTPGKPGEVATITWEKVGHSFDSYLGAELARLEWLGKEITRVTAVEVK
jgi:hypothetical protein